MAVISFIIALGALFLAFLAFKKAGGTKENVKEQLNAIRKKTAETLEKAEKAIRPSEEKKQKTEQK